MPLNTRRKAHVGGAGDWGWNWSRPIAIREPVWEGCTRDCLFGFPHSNDRGDHANQGEFFAEGWKPLFTVSGPLENGAFSDRCIIFDRERGGGVEYMPVLISERII